MKRTDLCGCKECKLGELLDDIEKITDKWFDTRYDTDWDSLMRKLSRIRGIVKKRI